MENPTRTNIRTRILLNTSIAAPRQKGYWHKVSQGQRNSRAVPFWRLAVYLSFIATLHAQTWSGYGHDAQHTGLSPVAAQPLNNIHWSTPVDLSPTPSGSLFVHYGSPSITAANTVLVPVKTGTDGGFEIQAFNGASGALLYTLTTNYSLPLHNWVPPYGPVLSVTQEAQVMLSRRGSPVAARSARVLKIAGTPLLCRPGRHRLLSRRVGYSRWSHGAGCLLRKQSLRRQRNGIQQFGSNLDAAGRRRPRKHLLRFHSPVESGKPGKRCIARIRTGTGPGTLAGTWVSAQAVAGGDPTITGVALNCTPALSNDGRTLYFAVSNGAEFGTGYLVSVDSETLAPIAHVALQDPRGGLATVSTKQHIFGFAVGRSPDGDVLLRGSRNNCCSSHNDPGLDAAPLNASLTQSKIPGSFGWDASASIVPAKLVPSYTGASAYLILTKYNNYAGAGTGTGLNQVAVQDPNTPMTDPVPGSSVQVMQTVLTMLGTTPDPTSGYPNAVREWCINTAAIDSVTNAAIVNSEDGTVYRWNFATNTFTQRKQLTSGRSESYTPTVIGADGTVYAINDAVLFAIGN